MFGLDRGLRGNLAESEWHRDGHHQVALDQGRQGHLAGLRCSLADALRRRHGGIRGGRSGCKSARSECTKPRHSHVLPLLTHFHLHLYANTHALGTLWSRTYLVNSSTARRTTELNIWHLQSTQRLFFWRQGQLQDYKSTFQPFYWNPTL